MMTALHVVQFYFKRWFCKHPRATWIRNIYGDEIRERGWHRSLWQCEDCQGIFTKPELVEGDRGT